MFLKKGNRGDNVKYLQYGLNIMCYGTNGIDGIYGQGTVNAVIKFQKKFGLGADGIVGNGTWNKLCSEIKKVQQALKDNGYLSSVDGVAGSGTFEAVKKFQRDHNLSADGMVGNGTWEKLRKKESHKSHESHSGNLLRMGSRGSEVKELQEKLIKKGYSVGSYGADGAFGRGTYDAVVRFQSDNGLSADGIVGPATWDKLNNSTSTSTSGGEVTEGFVSNKLVEFIKSYEGFSATMYRDCGGVPTIGYGSTHGWIMNRSHVTKEEATKALLEEINGMASQIKRNLNSKGIKLKQQEFDALSSFAYNLGVPTLLGSTLYKRICSGVRDTSLKHNFEVYCHVGKKVVQGLLNRRREEFDMFYKGDYKRNL